MPQNYALLSDCEVTNGCNSFNTNSRETLAFVIVVIKNFESKFFFDASMKLLSCT